MKVSFNPSINNNNFKYKKISFGSEFTNQNGYTSAELKDAKIKKTVYTLSLFTVAAGILYFGFKKGAKNMHIKAKKAALKKLKETPVPEVDPRVLNILRKAQ